MAAKDTAAPNESLSNPQSFNTPLPASLPQRNREIETPVTDAVDTKSKWGPLSVLGAFFLFMNTQGMITSYGVYQTYYKVALPNESHSNVAWIGSLQGFLLLLGSFLCGPFFDAGYLRSLLIIGTLLQSVGLFMTSLGDKYYQFMLAQGVCFGLGSGCLALISMSITPQWYPSPKGRALSLGLASMGSNVGGMIYPIIFDYVSSFRWAVRAQAFAVLATSLVPLALLRYNTIPDTRRKLVQLPMLREPTFLVVVVGGFFVYWGVWVPIFFVQYHFITQVRPGTSSDLNFWLIPILMACSAPGRILGAGLGAKYGCLNVLTAITLSASVLCFSWTGMHSTASIVVFVILYGFVSGALLALLPITLLSLASNQEHLGTRIGMASVFLAAGILTGSPVAGEIVWVYGSWIGLQTFAGAALVVGALLFTVTRFVHFGGVQVVGKL